MKKALILFTTLVLMFSFALSASAANSITNRLKGRLLLQVEKGGAIWYVNPVDLQKYQVTFANALNLFSKFALGITNADLIKIPADLDSINPSLDSDNDGYTDRVELQNGYSPYIASAGKGKFKIDNNLAKRLKGRLLLQVQQGGAIWYVDINGIRHNVRWNNLMDLFRRLALGITDKDLAEVGVIDYQTDNRILLTPENLNNIYNSLSISDRCNEKFNSYPANTTVTYSNSNKGISIKLPYNSNWGSNKYKINSYDEYSDRLNFGGMGVFEGCGWIRSYTLNFLPVKSADNVIADLNNSDNIFVLEPQKTTINGLEVVKYETGGMCTYPTFQVIGKKYNYELIPICGSGDEFEYLENIIKTIRFID